MPSHADEDTVRKRRSHTKSRQGCRNCKIRRVKCDETHPECNKCVNYGVACNYGGDDSTELQHAGEAAFFIEPSIPAPATVQDLSQPFVPPQLPPTPPSEMILNMLDHPLTLHDTDELYRVTESDLDLLRRFYDRTVLTIGTAQTVSIYRDNVMKVGIAHAYLTHIVFTLTLMHDRYLSADPWQPPTVKETFHHYHGTAIFNKMLSQPLPEEEKDAMWGAAAMLGAITVAAIEATRSEDSWPLKPDGPTDLDWLRMSDGKKEVWRLADPLREGSVWREALTYPYHDDPTPRAHRPELDSLFPFLIRLYNFDESAESNGDPYHAATSILVRLLPIECTHSTVMYFLSFLGHMDPEFRQLLHQKDHRAMLLLAWWYAKMIDYPAWWLQRRARIECKAICVYLGQRYMHYTDIGRLLDFPKMMCGMAVSSKFEREVERARTQECV